MKTLRIFIDREKGEATFIYEKNSLEHLGYVQTEMKHDSAYRVVDYIAQASQFGWNIKINNNEEQTNSTSAPAQWLNPHA